MNLFALAVRTNNLKTPRRGAGATARSLVRIPARARTEGIDPATVRTGGDRTLLLRVPPGHWRPDRAGIGIITMTLDDVRTVCRARAAVTEDIKWGADLV